MLALLHAIPDADDPYAIVAKVMNAVPSGSYLAITHTASDLLDQKTMATITDSWNSNAQQQFRWRSRDEVARFFAGLELADPGLVPIEQWRPEPGAAGEGISSVGWGAVGRKP